MVCFILRLIRKRIWSFAAISKSSVTKISVSLDFLQHLLTIEDYLFVDVDSLDVTPGLSQIENESEKEQDCYGNGFSLFIGSY